MMALHGWGSSQTRGDGLGQSSYKGDGMTYDTTLISYGGVWTFCLLDITPHSCVRLFIQIGMLRMRLK